MDRRFRRRDPETEARNEGKFKVLVVDGNLRSQRTMQRVLSADPEIVVVGTHKRGRSALQYLRFNKVDLVFLNPELGDINGFDLFSYLNDPPLVVIVSDRYDYGYFAFKIGAIAFINTDFTHKEFRDVIKRSREEVDRRRVYQEYLAAKELEAEKEKELAAAKAKEQAVAKEKEREARRSEKKEE